MGERDQGGLGNGRKTKGVFGRDTKFVVQVSIVGWCKIYESQGMDTWDPIFTLPYSFNVG